MGMRFKKGERRSERGKNKQLTNDTFSERNTTYSKLYTRHFSVSKTFLFFTPKPGSSHTKGTSKHSKGQNSLARRAATQNKKVPLFSLSLLIFFFSSSLSSKLRRNNEPITCYNTEGEEGSRSLFNNQKPFSVF